MYANRLRRHDLDPIPLKPEPFSAICEALKIKENPLSIFVCFGTERKTCQSGQHLGGQCELRTNLQSKEEEPY